MARAPNVQKILSGNFRDTQSAIGNSASGAIERFWNAGFAIKDARGSWNTIRPHIVMVLRKQFMASRVAGRQYYMASRVAAGLDVLPAAYEPSIALTDTWIGNTIDGSGVGSFLQYVGNGNMMMDAFNMARGNLSSASQTLVLAGGRNYVTEASKADPASNGVRRVTESNGGCDFCAGLAAQGVTPGDGGFHNNCQCQSEPSFEA